MDYDSVTSTESGGSSYSSSSINSCLTAFPVADGPLYAQKANFYKNLKKQRNRRAFSARCSRSEGKEKPLYNRCSTNDEPCQEQENILTEEDIARLFCVQRVAKAIVKQRSRTYRNPVVTLNQEPISINM